jgi:ATP-dependent DNA helicase RecG
LSTPLLRARVQKGKPLTEDAYSTFKAKPSIEGRRFDFFVSTEGAVTTETQAEYIRKRAFDKAHVKRMIVPYLEKFGEAKRRDLDKLLLKKISGALSDQPKDIGVRELIHLFLGGSYFWRLSIFFSA